MVDVFLSFDTEDPIHPAADDALLRLCRTIAGAGLQGCFFLVGEKARLLRERGRRDVLSALADHEIDYHGNWWFEFPECAMVYGDRPSWDEAVEYGTRIELPGLHDVAEIAGRWPTAWVQHQANCHAVVPQIMRRLGVPVWNGGFGGGPLTGWLMDEVVLTRSGHVCSLQGSWGSASHNPLDPRPSTTVMDPDTEFRAFQVAFDRVAGEHPVVVPLGHPTCWAVSEWWGWYDWAELTHPAGPKPYPRGRRMRQVPPRDPADIDAHFAWTRRVCEWLAQRDDVRVTTFGDYHQRVREPGLQWLSLADVDAVAAATVDGPTDLAVAGTTLSAADVLGVFAHLFAAIARDGRVLEEVAVQRLLGPVEAPWPAARQELLQADWWALAPELYDELVTTRRLPAVMRAHRCDLGPAAVVMMYARVWQHYRLHGTWPDRVTVEPTSDEPPIAARPFFTRTSASSTNAPPGFAVTRLADRVRWQSWSYREFVGA